MKQYVGFQWGVGGVRVLWWATGWWLGGDNQYKLSVSLGYIETVLKIIIKYTIIANTNDLHDAPLLTNNKRIKTFQR